MKLDVVPPKNDCHTCVSNLFKGGAIKGLFPFSPALFDTPAWLT